MLRALKRNLRILRAVANGNPPLQAAGFLRDYWLGKPALHRIKVCGEHLHIRASSPDVRVALASLAAEFEFLECLPSETRLRAGLIIDAGGYIGTAAIALSRLFPNADVISVEPSEANFSVLQKNIAALPRIRAVKAALVSDPALVPEIDLYDTGSDAWGFSVVKGARHKKKNIGPPTTLHRVMTTSIERLMAEAGASGALLVKMDVEDAEADLLGSPGWLHRTGDLPRFFGPFILGERPPNLSLT